MNRSETQGKAFLSPRLIGAWLGVIILLAVVLLGLDRTPAKAGAPVSTAFTYQGQLRDGGTATSGVFTFTFALFDDAIAGIQIGTTISQTLTTSQGLFTTQLDFGDVFDGTALWLEISVDGVLLTPRQPLTAAPYALHAPEDDGDPTNEYNTNVNFNTGLNLLEITDAGGTLFADLSPLIDDADADPTNEYNASANFDSGTNLLQITDGGGTLLVDLSTLAGGGPDADADPTNEYNTSANFDSGLNLLEITDGGGTLFVDLSALVDADTSTTNELQTLSMDNETGDLTLSSDGTVNVWEGAMALSANIALSEDDVSSSTLSGYNRITGNEATVTVAMPFSINIGGTNYSQLLISTNGWVELGSFSGSADLSNDCLPSANHSNPLIAAYWDDLTTAAEGVEYGYRGSVPNRVFVINYDAQTVTGSHETDFQIQIHEGSSLINVRYFDMDAGAIGQSATIGFQTAGGSAGKGYALGCNASILDDNANDGTGPSVEGWSISPIR